MRSADSLLLSLTEQAISLIENYPELINAFAKACCTVIAKADLLNTDNRSEANNISDFIQHVGYTREQCGYDK